VGSNFNLLHLQAIADAFKQRPGAQAVERMLRDLDSVPPSFEDFERALKGCSSTSSPGPTGLSYSLIKAFPLSAKKRLYELLCVLWADKTIPGFWKSKFLVMLAKEPGGTPTPDKLRPLGLMETTRKLWTVMILSKIKHAILKCKVLQPNHYGFLPNRGTDSELVQILNILEEAIEHQEGIDLITWDIKKAFDSVSQNIQYLAWRRLGVPRPIAAWLVALDNRGTFTVRSPYALNRIANVWNSPSAFADTQRILKEDGFEAEQGLTQGDVKSTLGWVAVFDILLTAMNDWAEQEHLQQVYLRHAGSFLYNSLALAFADDLVTISQTRETSLRLGQFVSTSLMVLGLKLAPDKLRMVTSRRDTLPLVVYDWDWRPLSKPFEDADHVVKILGLHLNLNLNWQPAYDLLAERLRRALTILAPKMGRLSTKLKVMTMSLQSQAMYVAQFASFTDK
jgi:hypothetical protein